MPKHYHNFWKKIAGIEVISANSMVATDTEIRATSGQLHGPSRGRAGAG
jgi:hypothetical protein